MFTPLVNKNVYSEDKENTSSQTFTDIVNTNDDCVNSFYKLKLRRGRERECTVFGKRLKEIRQNRGHTMESFGELVKVSKQQVYRWESSDSPPTGETLVLIAKALGVSADYLLGLVDEPTERLSEDDLSPMERRLITSLRSGALAEAIQTALTLNDEHKQADVSGK
jgi:transcriptional regulator with XRE-family HTH domain